LFPVGLVQKICPHGATVPFRWYQDKALERKYTPGITSCTRSLIIILGPIMVYTWYQVGLLQYMVWSQTLVRLRLPVEEGSGEFYLGMDVNMGHHM